MIVLFVILREKQMGGGGVTMALPPAAYLHADVADDGLGRRVGHVPAAEVGEVLRAAVRPAGRLLL
jgi:hypothetical protein